MIARKLQSEMHLSVACLHPLLLVGSLPSAVYAVAERHDAHIVEHTLHLTYRNFKADEVLAELLPPGVDAPRAYEAVGHIAHVNLKEEHLPYKHLIGQVLLDKNSPTIHTVVNKASNPVKCKICSFSF